MKLQTVAFALFLAFLLASCQTAGPSAPEPAALNTEITLAPGQSTTVTGSDLTVTFHGVISDERCPSQVECAASGPVTLSLSVQQGDGNPTDFTLQTFTDQTGRSPNVQFEGVTNRAEAGDYLIQIAGVTPYPESSVTEIQASDYRVALFILTK